ncbi:unnamed protein product [Tilletia laevis]|uniref:Uncharacterized protein n=1 Tax=Tilletia caries TaxID=13290 RepID=A0A177VGY2_9BASI|nr:hypothetical protein CF336_g5363 [Tilletia laevis]KAE8257598.1 hypothetical protein A4X03_0g4618 [Tilletia caries]KAE8197389.1 hypothetical protein CF335_g4626 [Tilletia laevis]CAD6884669.1 unnamed protein product [Tilletia caries]CAD6898960.1 unnamed protein product [Tilletia caries]
MPPHHNVLSRLISSDSSTTSSSVSHNQHGGRYSLSESYHNANPNPNQNYQHSTSPNSSARVHLSGMAGNSPSQKAKWGMKKEQGRIVCFVLGKSQVNRRRGSEGLPVPTISAHGSVAHIKSG